MKWTTKQGIVVEIREAQVSDAKAILTCMSAVFGETKNLAREPEEWVMTEEDEIKFLERTYQSKHDFMAVALVGDTIISTAGFHGRPQKRLQHRVTLGISILQKYHHQGIGRQMMLFLIEQAKRMNKRTIDLEVRADNHAAIALYKQVGFVVEGVKKEGFFVDGRYVDELLMAKYLEEEK